jgi:WD40 repeat protein
MATASNDKAIHIYNHNVKLLKSIFDAHDANIFYLAWVVNHTSLFISCSSDRSIKLWDSEKEGVIKVMKVNDI